MLQNEKWWYAAYTNHKHEKKVAKYLEWRNVEVYIPLLVVNKYYVCNRHYATLRLPIFPGYVFVNISLNDMHIVLNTPGVVSIVQRQNVGQTIPGAVIENLRFMLKERDARAYSVIDSEHSSETIVRKIASLNDRLRMIINKLPEELSSLIL